MEGEEGEIHVLAEEEEGNSRILGPFVSFNCLKKDLLNGDWWRVCK